jgi:hypothetical protein
MVFLRSTRPGIFEDNEMALSRRGWIRIVILALVTIAVASILVYGSRFRPTSGSDLVEVVEIYALILPLLWIDQKQKWAAIAAGEFLILFGFRAVQTWMLQKYVYASGFALCCAICIGILLWRLRRERTIG